MLAVPGPVSSERSVGCNRLIQDGARLVQNVDDVLAELSPIYLERLQRSGPAPVPPVPGGNGGADRRWPDESTVLQLFEDAAAVHVDELAGRAPFGIVRVLAALFGLEVQQAVESLPGGYYQLRRRPAGPRSANSR